MGKIAIEYQWTFPSVSFVNFCIFIQQFLTFFDVYTWVFQAQTKEPSVQKHTFPQLSCTAASTKYADAPSLMRISALVV